MVARADHDPGITGHRSASTLKVGISGMIVGISGKFGVADNFVADD